MTRESTVWFCIMVIGSASCYSEKDNIICAQSSNIFDSMSKTEVIDSNTLAILLINMLFPQV